MKLMKVACFLQMRHKHCLYPTDVEGRKSKSRSGEPQQSCWALARPLPCCERVVSERWTKNCWVSFVSMGTPTTWLCNRCLPSCCALARAPLLPPPSPHCSCGAKRLLRGFHWTQPTWHMVHFSLRCLLSLLTKWSSWKQHSLPPSCCVLCWCINDVTSGSLSGCCMALLLPCLHVVPV